MAVASLGAIWSSAAPEFGAKSVVDRFAQIEPKVLLAIDGYRYNGRDHDRSAVVQELADAIPSLEKVFTLPYLGAAEGNWDELVGSAGELAFEPVPFDHPLWVLYSSGTTGLPKAIVQGHGGILLEHLKKLHLHTDLHEGDRLFWFSTTGWMMWNFLVSGLLTDAAIVLYDGSPAVDDMNVVWDLAAQHRHDLLRHERRVHRRVHEGGRGAESRARSFAAARGRVDGLAAVARRGSTGSTSTWGATPGCSRPRAARTCARPSWAAWRRSRSIAGSCRPARWARRSRRSTSTATPSSTRSASWSSPSPCRRCRCTSGATSRASATARATSTCTRASGATATGSRSRRGGPP